jgi:hypothetical protein
MRRSSTRERLTRSFRRTGLPSRDFQLTSGSPWGLLPRRLVEITRHRSW